MSRTLSAILVAGMFLTANVVSCQSGKESDFSTEIDSLWNQFEDSWNQLDAGSVVQIYSEDAVIIPQEMSELVGRQAIEDFYSSLFASNQSALYTHTTESLSRWTDNAVELGYFKVDWVSNDREPWTFRARVMVHWKKQNSEWKIQSLMFNQPASNN